MTIRIEDKSISLSVRDLIRFNPNPSKVLSPFPFPQRGILGRQAQTKLQQSKQKSFGIFHKEFTVSHQFHYQNFKITLSGRIDGIYELKDRVEVEEIKTVLFNSTDFKNVDIDSFPEFIEQVSFYSYFLYLEHRSKKILPIVTLVNLVNERSRSFKLEFNHQEKKYYFNDLIMSYSI